MTADFDPEAFYVALDKERRKRGMSWRGIRRETGVSASTFTRIGTKWRNPSATNLVRLLVWLGVTDIGAFMVTAPTAVTPMTGQRDILAAIGE